MMFKSYHPLINFLYFTAVILFGMFIMHPVFLVAALFSSITYSIVLTGKHAIRFNLFAMLPMVVFIALLNPLFNREGSTVLFDVFGKYPVTLESILYGLAAAFMFVVIISWFSCYNVIVTSDKLQYLFGRLSPSLSLIISMTLRFIPRMKAQLIAISNAQRCIGRDVTNGTALQRAKHGMRILSIMFTWSLENAVDTADSMKSRGYGLPGRSSFSIFKFNRRDRVVLIAILALSSVLIGGITAGVIRFSYFPTLQAGPNSPLFYIACGSYLFLCIIPLIIEGLEVLRWKYSVSQI